MKLERDVFGDGGFTHVPPTEEEKEEDYYIGGRKAFYREKGLPVPGLDDEIHDDEV